MTPVFAEGGQSSAHIGALLQFPDPVERHAKDESDVLRAAEETLHMSADASRMAKRKTRVLATAPARATDDPRETLETRTVLNERDEKPVDGGVFDIPTDAETHVIPIYNPVAVSEPQAFVITLEQPGGVVVSKQEVVVALAKPI